MFPAKRDKLPKYQKVNASIKTPFTIINFDDHRSFIVEQIV